MTVVEDVVGGRAGARARLENEYQLLRGRSADGPLLDRLAVAAATSPAALEALLGLIRANRLAQPAIRRLVVDETDVDDVEQAVLAVVALKVSQFRGEARFTTWLHRVAGNEAKMFIRARLRRPPAAGSESPERGYLARLSSVIGNRDVVERALDAIPEHYRVALVLREVEHLGYEEIADRLDVPVGTVRSRLHKARELMAREIGSTD